MDKASMDLSSSLLSALGRAFVRRRRQAQKPVKRFTGLEGLESRVMLSATLDWAVGISPGNAGSATGNAVLLADSHVFSGGSFNGTVDINHGGGTLNFTSNNSGNGDDGYVVKYDLAGAFVDAWQFTSSSGSAIGVRGLASDETGLYIAGTFSGSIDLDPGNGASNVTGGNDSNIFVVKLDTNGDFVWGVTFGGAGNESFGSFGLVGGELAVVGSFDGTTNLGTLGTDLMVSSGTDNSSGFASFYSTTDGAFTKAFTLDGGSGFSSFGAIARDSMGDFILTGNVRGTDSVLNFRTTQGVTELATYDAAGDGDALIVKTDGATIAWDHLLEATTGFKSAKFDGIALDSNDNIYLAGQHAGTIDVDPGVGTNTLAGGQFSRPMVVSLDGNGNHRWGVSLNASEGEARTISVDTVNSETIVTVGGYFGGTGNFDPNGTAFPQSSVLGTGDAFIWQFNTNGTVDNAFVYGGGANQNVFGTVTPTGYDDVFGVAIGADGDIFATGPFGQAFPDGVDADMAPGNATSTLVNNGTGGSYVTRYSPNSTRDPNGGGGGGQQDTQFISDIDVAITSVTFPASVLEGTEGRGKVTVTISNDVEESLPRGVKATVEVYAMPVGGGNDILIGSRTNSSISNLAPGADKAFSIPVTLPANAAEGDYTFYAIVTDEVNDQSLESAAFGSTEVAPANVDLTIAIDDAKFKPDTNVVTGDGTTFKLPVTVTNGGNSPLANGVVDLTIHAIPNGGGDPVLISTISSVNLGTIKAGGAKKLNLEFALPNDLADGAYTFRVTVDADNDIEETNEGNNTDTTAGNSAVAVAEGNVDLVPDIDSFTLPTTITGDKAVKGNVRIEIASTGNIDLVKTASANLTVVLRPADAMDNSQDITIGTATAKIGGLKANTAKTFNVKTTVDAVAQGDYKLAVVMTTTNVDETNTNNNSDVDAQTFTVAAGQNGGGDNDDEVIAGLGDLTFTETEATPAGILITTVGNLTSTAQKSGSYAYAVIRSFNGINPPAQQQRTARLELFGQIANGSSGEIDLVFKKVTDRPESINGKTLKFTSSKTPNSLGEFEVQVLGNETPHTKGFFEFVV
jgi:hypothetical protein